MVENKRIKLQSADVKFEHRTGISHLWWIAKGLRGKRPRNSSYKGVQFADKYLLDPKKIGKKIRSSINTTTNTSGRR